MKQLEIRKEISEKLPNDVTKLVACFYKDEDYYLAYHYIPGDDFQDIEDKEGFKRFEKFFQFKSKERFEKYEFLFNTVDHMN